MYPYIKTTQKKYFDPEYIDNNNYFSNLNYEDTFEDKLYPNSKKDTYDDKHYHYSKKDSYGDYNYPKKDSYDNKYYPYHKKDTYDKRYKPQEPSLRYIPTPVIRDYIGQVINTYIPGYGRVNVYVKGVDRYGMAHLVILNPKPKDYLYVHSSDMVGIYPPTL